MYKGVRITVLSPPWVFRLGQAMLENWPVKPADRARFVNWCREQARLERCQKRLADERAAKAKPVIRILR